MLIPLVLNTFSTLERGSAWRTWSLVMLVSVENISSLFTVKTLWNMLLSWLLSDAFGALWGLMLRGCGLFDGAGSCGSQIHRVLYLCEEHLLSLIMLVPVGDSSSLATVNVPYPCCPLFVLNTFRAL
jgi:hypothetical protein